MTDLLRPLLDAIETVRTRISNHRTYLEADETRTRVSLVDPILRALGWDPSDPEAVAIEWKIEGESVDYALLGDDGAPVAIVEAKKLGTSLGRGPRRQTGGYVLGAEVGLALLTDGDSWEIYDLRKVESGEMRSRVDVSTDESHTAALKLLELWRSRVCSQRWRGQPRRPDKNGERQDIDGPGTGAVIGPPAHDGWVPLEEIPKGPKPPARVRFLDQDPISPSDWPDLVVHAVRWLHERGELAEIQMPFHHSSKAAPAVRVQTDSPAPGWRPVPGTDLEVSTVAPSWTFVERAKGLLRACGRSPDSVLAKPRK